jgi:hypothetical protein
VRPPCSSAEKQGSSTKRCAAVDLMTQTKRTGFGVHRRRRTSSPAQGRRQKSPPSRSRTEFLSRLSIQPTFKTTPPWTDGERNTYRPPLVGVSTTVHLQTRALVRLLEYGYGAQSRRSRWRCCVHARRDSRSPFPSAADEQWPSAGVPSSHCCGVQTSARVRITTDAADGSTHASAFLQCKVRRSVRASERQGTEVNRERTHPIRQYSLVANVSRPTCLTATENNVYLVQFYTKEQQIFCTKNDILFYTKKQQIFGDRGSTDYTGTMFDLVCTPSYLHTISLANATCRNKDTCHVQK